MYLNDGVRNSSFYVCNSLSSSLFIQINQNCCPFLCIVNVVSLSPQFCIDQKNILLTRHRIIHHCHHSIVLILFHISSWFWVVADFTGKHSHRSFYHLFYSSFMALVTFLFILILTK